jgi:hypothetical protein
MPQSSSNSVSFENPVHRQSSQQTVKRTRSSLSGVGNIPILGDEIQINRKRRGPAYKQPSVKHATRYKVSLSV